MHLSPPDFNRLLADMGQRIQWRPSAVCPCISPHSGAADPQCAHCAGKGRRWGGAQASVVGIVSREIVRQYAPMMVIDAGDVMLVIPSDQSAYGLGEYDRVILTDRTEPFSLNVVAGVSDVLRFLPVSLIGATWLDADQALVTGQPPAVGEDGTLTWPDPDAAPTTGAAYALSGRRHPEYFCYLSLPLDRPHHRGAALPRRVVLRRFDLFGS